MSEDLQIVKRCVAIILKQFDFTKKELNQKWLQQLKDIIRKNVGVVEEFVDYIFENLRKENSDLRLCLVLLVDYFFQRSHKFRLEIIDHLQDFLVYTIETDPLHYPLPRPPEAANTLKSHSIKMIRMWIDKFSDGYSKLKNLNEFLNTSKSFDFTRANAELLVERQRNLEEQERNTRKSQKIVEKVQKLYEENLADMDKCLTEAKTAIELVFPKFDAELSDESSMKETTFTNQLHGLTAHSSSVYIVLPANGAQITETDDNVDLFNALKDITKLLEFHLKNVNKWLQKLSGTENSTEMIKTLIDLKIKLNVEIQKCKELGVEKVGRKSGEKNSHQSESSDNEDDEFVDVEKEGLELNFSLDREEPIPQHVLDRIAELDRREDQPGPSGIQATKKLPLEKSNKPTVPILDYGLDLKYWGQKVVPAEIPKNQYEEHRFWRPPDQDEQATESEEVYKTRTITFVGEMPAIKKRCRAPLPSGKLCPRMDRTKCPLHGDIIDRDEMGFPVEVQNGKQNALQAESEYIQKQQEKEEDDYLRDVERQTGKTLTIQSNRGRIKKREKSEAVKTRERLSTKLFDRKALKRVTDTLLAIQKTRAERRFANQYNYVVTNKK